MALQKQTITIPLSQGLDTKTSDQVLPPGKLTAAENVRFIEPGMLTKRLGFTDRAMAIHGGGTITGTKAMGTRQDEVFLLADDSVYSWLPQDSEWSDRGFYQPVYATLRGVADDPQEQRYADRAELGGVALIAWEDPYDLSSNGTEVKYAVIDAATGAHYVDVQGTYSGAGNRNTERPLCLVTTNRLVLLFMSPGNNTLYAHYIDPTDVAGTVGDSFVAVGSNLRSDATRAFDAVNETGTEYFVVYNNTASSSTQYTAVKMNETAVVDTVNVARASDGMICCSYGSTQDVLFVGRVTGNTLKADFLDNASSLADTATVNVTIKSKAAADTWINVTSERHSAVGGEDRIYVFDTRLVSNTGSVYTGGAYLTGLTSQDSDGTGGTVNVDPFAWHSRIVSRAFTDGTDVFVHLSNMLTSQSGASGIDVQRTIFLMKANASNRPYTIARILPGEAGSEIETGGGRTLPHVQNVSSIYKWAPIFRQRLTVTNPDDNQFSNRAVKEVTYDFASIKPFISTELGNCAYMTGGYVACYDGIGVVESGFHLFPEDISLAETTGGSLTATSSYSYKVFYEWTNAQGERERSTYEGASSITLTGVNNAVQIRVPTMPFTIKDPAFGRENISIVVYRTQADPGDGALYYRITSPDPSNISPADTTIEAGYARNVIANDGNLITDHVSDANLISNELLVDSAEVEATAVEPAGFIKSGQFRLFLADLEDPNMVRFSKLKFRGIEAATADVFTIVVPQDGGPITAVEPFDQNLVIFKRDRLYLVSGNGPNNANQGGYSDAQLISSDTGCSEARSVIQTPLGLMFMSPKGFYLLDRGFVLQYIGAPVEDLDDVTITGAVLSENWQQVIFQASSSRTLVYDYFSGQWSTWTISGDSLVIDGNGNLLRLDADVVSQQATAASSCQDNATGYSMAAETGWIRVDGVAGFGRVRRIAILGRYGGTVHNVRIRVAYDDVASWVDDFTVTPGATTYCQRLRLTRQKIRSIKIRIEDTKNGATELNNSAQWTGIALELAVKGGITRLPAAQTQ